MKILYIFMIQVFVNVSLVSSFTSSGTDTAMSGNICSPFLNSKCNCFDDMTSYSILCPAQEPSVEIRLFPQENTLDIKCNSFINATENQLNVLPDVSFDIRTFRIESCILEVISFENIAEKFNITNLRNLHIDDCLLGNKSMSQVDSKFFGEMNSLESLTIRNISKTFANNSFEHFPYLKGLSLEQNNLTEIGYFFENNPKLEYLDLKENHIKKLPNGAFYKLNDLQELHLQKNELTQITENYFQGLDSLKSLNLSVNFISHIDEYAFSYLNELVNISLTSNQLENISSNIFKYNIKLQNIRLECNPLKLIPDYLFANLKNLKNIYLDNTGLENIFEHTFENCTSLISLEMQNNKLKHVPPTLIESLKMLKVLNLSNNTLELLPDNFFSSLESHNSLSNQFPISNKLYVAMTLNFCSRFFFNNRPKLEYLDLKGNSLKNLPVGTFEKLSNLQGLFLYGNKLSEIKNNYFDGLDSLKSLDLSMNFISHIEENAFSQLKNLVNISLRLNRLGNISSNIFKLNSKLENIRLDGNPQLLILDYVFADLENLKTIDLANSSLEEIFEHTFENCISLISLGMQNNNIKHLPSNLFKSLKKLKTLNLGNNKLEIVPDEIFCSLENLEALNLESNQLSVIKYSILRNLRKLKLLNLKDNKISNIDPEAFVTLSNIITLDLSYNQLNEKQLNRFSPLQKIEQLNLTHNHISFLPKSFFMISPCLKVIDFRYNSLSEIFVTSLVRVTNHTAINLGHNNISHINFMGAESLLIEPLSRYTEVIKERITSKIQVDMSNNPLICDCRNYDLIEYLRGTLEYDLRPLIDIRMENMTCFGPKDFENILITDLSPQEVTCSDNHNCPFECTCFRRPYDDAFIVDCSYKNLTHLPSLKIQHQKLEIIAVGNLIKRGPEKGEGYENVTNLNLSNNKLTSFDWCPPHIEKVNLSHNSLQTLNRVVLNSFELSKNLSQLILGQNPWKCACEIQQFVSNHSRKFNIDTDNIFCGEDNTALIQKKLCTSDPTKIIIPILSIFLVAAIATAAYSRFEQEIKIWLFSNKLCLWFVTEEELDKGKKYDIFLSFSHKDEDFVIQNLIPTLEKSFKLCIHSRDWIPGELINNQIVDSVYNSRRTLVVLSNNFLESAWGKLEFLMAHKQSLEEGRPRVIVIKLNDLNLDKMNNDFKAYLKTNTYVEWGDPWFWKKLLYSLPHPDHKIAKENQEYPKIICKHNEEIEVS